MTRTYSAVKLVGFDDPDYQEYIAPFVLARRRWKRAPMAARAQFGQEVEEVLRDWLATQAPLSPERVLTYIEHGGGRVARNFRELDAVEVVGLEALIFYEIKASRSLLAFRRAVSQVRKTAAILSTAFKLVRGVILFVCTDDDVRPEIEQVVVKVDELSLLAGLEDRLALVRPTGVLLMGVGDVVALAGERRLTLEWEDEEGEAVMIEFEDREWVDDWEAYLAEQEDEDIGPFGRALLAALEGGDER